MKLKINKVYAFSTMGALRLSPQLSQLKHENGLLLCSLSKVTVHLGFAGYFSSVKQFSKYPFHSFILPNLVLLRSPCSWKEYECFLNELLLVITHWIGVIMLMHCCNIRQAGPIMRTLSEQNGTTF